MGYKEPKRLEGIILPNCVDHNYLDVLETQAEMIRNITELASHVQFLRETVESVSVEQTTLASLRESFDNVQNAFVEILNTLRAIPDLFNLNNMQ